MKNCPFCGSLKVSLIDSYGNKVWKSNYSVANNSYAVLCLTCNATSGYTGTEGGAVAKWDMRDDNFNVDTENTKFIRCIFERCKEVLVNECEILKKEIEEYELERVLEGSE